MAYRALNKILHSVVCFDPQEEKDLFAVWDDFLMQKVLPRIEGDSQKLKAFTSTKTESLKVDNFDYGKGSILHALYDLLETDLLKEIWDGQKRPDLMREAAGLIGCRSKRKLEWMMKRLKSNHFTDFWV